MSNLTDAQEYQLMARYASGEADMCSKILQLFDSELSPTMREWLYDTRHDRRERTSKDLDKALELLKGDE